MRATARVLGRAWGARHPRVGHLLHSAHIATYGERAVDADVTAEGRSSTGRDRGLALCLDRRGQAPGGAHQWPADGEVEALLAVGAAISRVRGAGAAPGGATTG